MVIPLLLVIRSVGHSLASIFYCYLCINKLTCWDGLFQTRKANWFGGSLTIFDIDTDNYPHLIQGINFLALDCEFLLRTFHLSVN